MGLICVKSIKAAAGEQFMLGSDYVFTPIPIALDNGGVKYFVSYQEQAVVSMSIGIEGGVDQYFFSHNETPETTMSIGVQADSFAQFLSQPVETAGVIPLTLGGNVP